MKGAIVCLGVILSFGVVSTIRAEQSPLDLPLDCRGGWWVEHSDIPVSVRNAPLTPTLLLPIQWDLAAQNADTGSISVEVTTVTGEVIAGSVIHGEALLPQGLPRWRPDAPLSADTYYEVQLRVAAPPPLMPAACGYRGFERLLTIRTGDGADIEASLADATLEASLSPRGTWEIGKEVCETDFDGRCPELDYVCCRFDQVGQQGQVIAHFNVVSLGRAEPLYYQLEASISGLGVGDKSLKWSSIEAGSLQSLYTNVLDLPMVFNGDSVCVTASLTDLLADKVVATVEHCGIEVQDATFVPGPGQSACPYECPRAPGPPKPGVKVDTSEGDEDQRVEVEFPTDRSGCGAGLVGGPWWLMVFVWVWGRRIVQGSSRNV